MHVQDAVIRLGGDPRRVSVPWQCDRDGDDGIQALRSSADCTGTELPGQVCRQVVPVMERQGKGAIVNIASIAAHRWTGISYASYYASKAGVVALSRSIALEFAAKGIRCNSVSPGLMNTPMVHHGLTGAYGAEGDVANLVRVRDAQCPMGHMGTGWDTAHACLFLASDEAGYITAHDIVVDGGLIAKIA